MAVTKENTRVNNSSFFETPKLTSVEEKYILVEEDTADPGRIALKLGFTHDQWSLVLAFNRIIDPFVDLVPGLEIIVPSVLDVRNLR